jgi:beta-phosphoglucomutase-like phosphatase (HAD superfamily)
MLQAVILEMEGVIADSEPIKIGARDTLLRQSGIIVNENYHHQFIDCNTHSFCQRVKEEFALPLSVEELVRQTMQIYSNIVREKGLKPMTGVSDLIALLYKHNMKLAIVAQLPLEDVTATVELFNIKHYFSILMAEQDSQPTDMLLKTANLIAIEPRNCLVIESSSLKISAAIEADMLTIGYQDPRAVKQDLTHASMVVNSLTDINIPLCKTLFSDRHYT